jgi:3-methyl-2-oxobutanoate hydroxymethyltransferase
MRCHTESAARGIRRVQGTAWIMGDLPFGSDQESKEPALRSATERIQAGAMGAYVRAIKTSQFPDNTLHAW